MAVPKRRQSKSRRNKRRSQQKIGLPAMMECPQCEATMLPHNACQQCGYYKGRKVDHTVKEKSEKREGA